MRAAALALLLSASACGEDAIVVTVSGRPTLREPASLRVEVGDGTDRVETVLDLGGDPTLPRTFVVATSGRSGTLEVSVDAVDAEGAVLGRGVGQGALAGDGELAVMLDPSDFVVNTRVVGPQQLSVAQYGSARQVASTPDGRFIVAWQSDRTSFARLFAADARPAPNATEIIDLEFEIPIVTGPTDEVAIGHAGDGYAAVWEAPRPAGGPVDLFMHTYADGDASRRSINDVAVAIGDATSSHRGAAIAGGTDGGFAMVWLRTARPQDARGVVQLRRFDRTGEPVGLAVAASVAAAATDESPAAVGLTDGAVAVAWIGEVAGGSRVVARIFDRATPRTADLTIDQPASTFARAFAPQLAALDDGGFVAVWVASRVDGTTLRLRRFGADGAPRGAEVVVVATVDFQVPAVATRADGAVAVAWSTGPMGDEDLWMQVVGADDVLVGAPVALATTTVGTQRAPALARFAADGFVASWTDHSQAAPDPSDAAVRARILYLP